LSFTVRPTDVPKRKDTAMSNTFGSRTYTKCPVCDRTLPSVMIQAHVESCLSALGNAPAHDPPSSKRPPSPLPAKEKKNALSQLMTHRSSSQNSSLPANQRKKRKISSSFAKQRQKRSATLTQGTPEVEVEKVWGDDGKILGWNLCPGLSTTKGGLSRPLRPGVRVEVWRQSRTSPFVRFGFSRTEIIGKLEQEVAAFLAPLIDHGLLSASAICQSAPEKLSHWSTVQLLVQINVLSPLLFSNHPAQSALKDASFLLVRWIFPTVSATCSGLSTDEGGKPPQVGIGGEGGQGPEDIVKDVDDGPDGEVVDQNVLSKASQEALLEDSLGLHDDIATIAPPVSLNVEMRPYQLDALSWMKARELAKVESFEMLKPPSKGRDGKHFAGSAGSLLDAHPLWLKCKFEDPSATPAEQTFVYVNPYSRRTQMETPPMIQECRGGILADEMGMGKTIEMLSLLASDKEERQETAKGSFSISEAADSCEDGHATLVVVPMSVLGQWGSEIKSHVKGMSVYTYYGSEKKDLSFHRLKTSDVVLTTYGTLSAEAQRIAGSGQAGQSLLQLHWRRLVLDEAHTIKNKATLAAQAVTSIRASRRWCMTGTPMQNGIQDLFSLIKFLRHQPWSEPLWWNRVIKAPFDEGDEKAKDRLRAVLGPIILRRTKDTVDRTTGKAIVTLPKRNIQLHAVEFSDAESDFYKALYMRSKAEFDGYVATGTLSSNYATILTLLLRLRQACNHPFLVLGKGDGGSNRDSAKKKYVGKLYHKFISNSNLDLSSSESKGRAAEDAGDAGSGTAARTIPAGAGQSQLRAGASSAAMSPSATIAHQPEFIRNLFAELEKDGVSNMECPVCLDPPDQACLTPCGHLMCRECLFGSMKYFSCAKCPVCRQKVEMGRVVSLSESIEASAPTMRDLESKGKMVRSAKLDAMVDILSTHVVGRAKKHGKAVVFSQWTYMLDLVGFVLKEEGIRFARLDGSMSQRAREKAIENFRKDPKVNVMVMSLKAGGLGLNLTCASLVILMDLWWNPAVEHQAINRCHRIGQTRQVDVFRFIVSGSCEQKMLDIHKKKNDLSKSLMLEGSELGQKAGRLDIDDLKSFFL
jgi:DNA repair protein RAD5